MGWPEEVCCYQVVLIGFRERESDVWFHVQQATVFLAEWMGWESANVFHSVARPCFVFSEQATVFLRGRGASQTSAAL